jgi:hypothetical protein
MKVTTLYAWLREKRMSMNDFARSISRNRSYMCRVAVGTQIPGWKTAKAVYEMTNGIVDLEHKPVRTKDDKKQKQRIQYENCG